MQIGRDEVVLRSLQKDSLHVVTGLHAGSQHDRRGDSFVPKTSCNNLPGRPVTNVWIRLTGVRSSWRMLIRRVLSLVAVTLPWGSVCVWLVGVTSLGSLS